MNAVSIKVYASQLEESLAKEIQKISSQNANEVVRYSRALHSVKEMISKLREFTYSYQFKSKTEEIEFFKLIKPSMLGQFYYYDKLISFSVDAPKGDAVKFQAFCDHVLKNINAFTKENFDFFKYCTSSASHLDEMYFLSKGGDIDNPNRDLRFSTGYDIVLAQFISDQLLEKFIRAKTETLSQPMAGSGLCWTTKKAHLVELIYALHTANAFNDGKAELKQIASTFENLFQIRLGNLYRQFQEIGLRKINKTVFIDQLKQTLEERLGRLD